MAVEYDWACKACSQITQAGNHICSHCGWPADASADEIFLYCNRAVNKSIQNNH